MNLSRIITVALTMTALLALPGAAQAACPAGITNELSVVPPAYVWSGQTQRQDYRVTACTTTDRVTVEWVRVVNSTQPWMGNPSNRMTIVPEFSMGTAMTGFTSWTAPANVTPGHYGVITRYYAAGSAYPEAQAASSFAVAQDACPNIVGGQDAIPAGSFANAAGACVPDVCVNIASGQEATPDGMVNNAGNCTIILTPTGETPAPLTTRPVIVKRANVKQVRTGGRVIYTITLANRGTGAMQNVNMCDKIPAGMTYISHTGKNSYFTRGSVCWKAATLDAGKSLTVKVTMQVGKNFKGKRIVNTVCATSTNAARVCAKAPVKVIPVRHKQPVGGVTG